MVYIGKRLTVTKAICLKIQNYPQVGHYQYPGYAFYEEKNLTSVKIPETVSRIGNWAFLDCED